MSAGTLFFCAPAVIARSCAAIAESRLELTAIEMGGPVGAAGGATSPVAPAQGIHDRGRRILGRLADA